LLNHGIDGRTQPTEICNVQTPCQFRPWPCAYFMPLILRRFFPTACGTEQPTGLF